MNVAATYLKELVKCAASTEVDAATNDAILWANDTIQRLEEAKGVIANISILLSMLKFDNVESNAVAISYMTGGGSAMLTVSDLEAINKTMLPSGEMTHIEQSILLESRKGVSLLIGLLKASQKEHQYYLGEENYYINERIEALKNRHKKLTERQKEVDELQDWRPEDFTIEFVEVPEINSMEDAAKYINSAETPEERQRRKQELYVQLYSSPAPIAQVIHKCENCKDTGEVNGQPCYYGCPTVPR